VNEQHSAAIEHLGAMLLADLIDLDGFETATSRVLATTSNDELGTVLRALPSTISWSSPERRLDQPLVITGTSSSIRMQGTWQLARTTTITTTSGSVSLDLGTAELDDEVIDLHVMTTSGSVRIVVPYGIGVQLVRTTTTSGSVKNRLGATPQLPGMPLIRLSLQTTSGSVKLQRPNTPRSRRRRRRFRLWRGADR